MKPMQELGDAIRLLALGRLPFSRQNIDTLFRQLSVCAGTDDEGVELRVHPPRMLERHFRKDVYRAWPRVDFERCLRDQRRHLVAAIRAWRRLIPDPVVPIRLYDKVGVRFPREHIFLRLQTVRDRVHRIAAGDSRTVLCGVNEAFRLAACREEHVDEVDLLFLSSRPYWPRFYECPACGQVGLNRHQGRLHDCTWCSPDSRWKRQRKRKWAALQQFQQSLLREIAGLQSIGVPDAVETIRGRHGVKPKQMFELLPDA